MRLEFWCADNAVYTYVDYIAADKLEVWCKYSIIIVVIYKSVGASKKKHNFSWIEPYNWESR